jgi:hypothetical protein
MKNLASFGPVGCYFDLINLVDNNKHLWRKSARMVNTVRRNMKVHQMVDRQRQIQENIKYIDRALSDMKAPEPVKVALKTGLNFEFKFNQ